MPASGPSRVLIPQLNRLLDQFTLVLCASLIDAGALIRSPRGRTPQLARDIRLERCPGSGYGLPGVEWSCGTGRVWKAGWFPSCRPTCSADHHGPGRCGAGGGRSSRSSRHTSRSARAARRRRRPGRRGRSAAARRAWAGSARAAAQRARRSSSSAVAASSSGPTSRHSGSSSSRSACTAQANARQRSRSRGDVHTPVTAGWAPQPPHCPARTCTENAQPGADGEKGSGSRSARALERSGTAGSPGRRRCGPRGGSAPDERSSLDRREPGLVRLRP